LGVRKKLTDEELRARRAVYMREWTAKNAEKVNARRSAWRAANREKLAEKQRQYNVEKRDEIADRRKQRNETNLEQRRAYVRRNRDKVYAQIMRRRARIAGAPGADYTTADHIRSRWEMWGNKCRYCGEPANTTDHRIPIARGGSNFPANLVPCCSGCNARKYTKTEREFAVWA
jgi:5-methylcytosine-specific restriction endonuclease McrA